MMYLITAYAGKDRLWITTMKSDNSFHKFDTPATDEWRIGTEFNGGIHGLIGAFSRNLSRGNEGTPKI